MRHITEIVRDNEEAARKYGVCPRCQQTKKSTKARKLPGDYNKTETMCGDCFRDVCLDLA